MAGTFDKEIKESMKSSKKVPSLDKALQEEFKDAPYIDRTPRKQDAPKTPKPLIMNRSQEHWDKLQNAFDEHERKKKEKFDNNPIVKGTRKAKDTVSSFIDGLVGEDK